MADLRWNSVNANFNDVNSAMGNSISGISQAGTIFGDLRKSILDEEQRAVDNAFREKQFDEQVSQFAAAHGLNENKLREQIRHNQEYERLTGEGHEVQIRGQDLSHKAAMAGVDAQNDGNALKKRIYDDEQNRSDILTKVTQDVLGPFQALEKEKADLTTAINSGTLTDDALTTSEARLAQIEGLIRTDYSASAMHNRIINETTIRGGGIPTTTSMANEAAAEQARTAASLARKDEAAKVYEQSQVKANEIQSKLNLGIEDSNALQEAMSKVQEQYPTLKPEIAMSILASFYPTTGEIFTTKQKFDVPITKPDYLVDFNPTDKRNPIAIRIAQAANNSKNLLSGKDKKPLSGSGDTTETPDSTLSDDTDTNLGSLTDEALAYRKEKVLASQPSEPSPEQVQAIYKQLVRRFWSDTPIDKIPPNALKNLEEMSVQGAKSVIQKERARVTKPIDDEMRTRQQNRNIYSDPNMYNKGV